MTPSARRLTASLLTLGAITLAVPASAFAHGHARTDHHHHATTEKSKSKAKAEHHDTRHEKKAAAPAGVVTVPAGGVKVFCATKSPLLIRKSTQGKGTTVTVICR